MPGRGSRLQSRHRRSGRRRNDGRDNSFGTNGYATITSPGNDPYVITVGAMKSMGTPTRADDQIASYSSKGPTLIDHMPSPTSSRRATKSSRFWPHPTPHSYALRQRQGSAELLHDRRHDFRIDGLLRPQRHKHGDAGGKRRAALLLQQNPLLSPDQVKARLMKTAYEESGAAEIQIASCVGSSCLICVAACGSMSCSSISSDSG